MRLVGVISVIGLIVFVVVMLVWLGWMDYLVSKEMQKERNTEGEDSNNEEGNKLDAEKASAQHDVASNMTSLPTHEIPESH